MKLIAIGDTHGKNYWKSLVHTQAFDKLIFIGDYFDAGNISTAEQMDNFRDIVAFKRAHPGKVILLIGNHDFHYLPVAMQASEVYSGFQEDEAPQISQLIQENLDQLQICYQWETYLFTHAGVTQTWLDNAGYQEGPVDVFINNLFHNQPRHFFFDGYEPTGNDVTQSPIWVRPVSLQDDAYNATTTMQVVGHTKVRKLMILQERLFFIDTLNASREYLVIDDGQVSIGTIN